MDSLGGYLFLEPADVLARDYRGIALGSARGMVLRFHQSFSYGGSRTADA